MECLDFVTQVYAAASAVGGKKMEPIFDYIDVSITKVEQEGVPERGVGTERVYSMVRVVASSQMRRQRFLVGG